MILNLNPPPIKDGGITFVWYGWFNKLYKYVLAVYSELSASLASYLPLTGGDLSGPLGVNTPATTGISLEVSGKFLLKNGSLIQVSLGNSEGSGITNGVYSSGADTTLYLEQLGSGLALEVSGRSVFYDSSDVQGMIRATSLNTVPTTGAGVELFYTSGVGYILGRDRSGAGSYKSINIFAGPNIQILSQGAGSELVLGTINTTQFGIESDGRLYGKSMHNVGTVTGTTKQYIASGTYTPTGGTTLNLTSVTPEVCLWSRVGNVVTLSGVISSNATAAGTCEGYFSLPIASNFTDAYQACGTGSFGAGSPPNIGLYSDSTNDRIVFQYIATAAGNSAFRFILQYLIA